jgi:hypothetical protein
MLNKFEVHDGMVAVGTGVAFPQRISGVFPDSDHAGISISAGAHYSSSAERFVLHSLTVESNDPQIEVTGTLLRALPVRGYHRQAGSELPYFDLFSNSWSTVPAIQAKPDDLDELLADGPAQRTLEAVAKYYRIAEVLGYRPAAHIQKLFHLPTSTASEWIKSARDFFPTVVSIELETDRLNSMNIDQLLQQARAFALGDR